MTVTATIDAASRNQIGQPAAWISANKIQSPLMNTQIAADCIRFTVPGQVHAREMRMRQADRLGESGAFFRVMSDFPQPLWTTMDPFRRATDPLIQPPSPLSVQKV